MLSIKRVNQRQKRVVLLLVLVSLILSVVLGAGGKNMQAADKNDAQETSQTLEAKSSTAVSLQNELDAYKQQFLQQAPPEAVQVIQSGNASVQSLGLEQKSLKPGQKIPFFQLPNALNQTVSIKQLLKKGPVVIVFYRGGWCPYCNLQLRALQSRLTDITAAGASLIAVSPQSPDSSASTKEKANLAFEVLSDAGSQVAHKFGIAYELPESLKGLYKSFGIDLGKINGNKTGDLSKAYVLPAPATYIVNQSGVILAASVDSDYTKRMEPQAIIDYLKVRQ